MDGGPFFIPRRVEVVDSFLNEQPYAVALHGILQVKAVVSLETNVQSTKR